MFEESCVLQLNQEQLWRANAECSIGVKKAQQNWSSIAFTHSFVCSLLFSFHLEGTKEKIQMAWICTEIDI